MAGFRPWGVAYGLLVGLTTWSAEAAGYALVAGFLVDLGRIQGLLGTRHARREPAPWWIAPRVGGLEARAWVGASLLGLVLWLGLGALVNVPWVLWLVGAVGPVLVEQVGPPLVLRAALARNAPRLVGEASDLLGLVYALGWIAALAVVVAVLPGMGRVVRIDRARRSQGNRWARLALWLALGVLLAWGGPYRETTLERVCRDRSWLAYCSGVPSLLYASLSFLILAGAAVQALVPLSALLWAGRAKKPRRRGAGLGLQVGRAAPRS